MIGHKWERIKPLEQSCGYDFAELDSLQRQWLNFKHQREQGSPGAYTAFLERLGRSWAIETGIIEGLYTLDRGVTETLVERGISADLIDRGSTNKDPHELVRMLRDHQEAAEGVYLEIRDGKPITRSAIRQIHSILTKNQPTYRAVDQFGSWFDAELHHGEFKKLPNNPTRGDGAVHEYCPPEHVDSELDNLLNWYGEYQLQEAYHPILTGAWLHHRFTQIHPFQDGNGRVVRTLLTWHLTREGYLPVVINREDRGHYIGALEAADEGNLYPLVDLLVQIEKQTILEALGEAEPVVGSSIVDRVIDQIAERIKQQNRVDREQLLSVNTVAIALRENAASSLTIQGEQIHQRFGEAGLVVGHEIHHDTSYNKHRYRSEVVRTARDAQYWVNLNESNFFIQLSVYPQEQFWTPRLVFVISLHHVGQQLTGVMAATAFALIVRSGDRSAEDSEEPAGPYFRNCTISPFTFTWQDGCADIAPRFNDWIEERLSIALRYWSEFIS